MAPGNFMSLNLSEGQQNSPTRNETHSRICLGVKAFENLHTEHMHFNRLHRAEHLQSTSLIKLTHLWGQVLHSGRIVK